MLALSPFYAIPPKNYWDVAHDMEIAEWAAKIAEKKGIPLHEAVAATVAEVKELHERFRHDLIVAREKGNTEKAVILEGSLIILSIRLRGIKAAREAA